MTLQTVHLLTLLLGLAAYLALTVFCIVTWIRRITGRAAFAAAVLSLLFLLSLALTGIGPISFTLEVLALLAWMTLLIRVIGIGWRGAANPGYRPVMLVFAAACLLALGTAGYAWLLAYASTRGVVLTVSWLFVGELLVAICGLVLLEQVVRNTREDLQFRLRFLNIGIGTLFAFELVHNACALLFQAYMPALVTIQPAVYAIAAPFVAMASLRNPSKPLKLNLSRRFVFRSGMLMTTGGLLLVMGLLGYLVRALEGNWAAAALALVLTLTAVAVITVFSSPQVRLRARRWLEEHLFASKYDYREQWRSVTAQLTEPSPDYDLAQQVLRALGGPLGSHGGAVWRASEHQLLVPVSQLHCSWREPLSPGASRRLLSFFETHDWVLDLTNLPDSARELLDRNDLNALPGLRFLIPLMVDARVFGVAGLSQPAVPVRLTWEDYDMLKLIARESAGFLALREAERELADADKLNSFSQISAFIVHDVKTISAQLSLMLENARRHRANPVFIDDMMATVGNAVQRMQKLLAQLREGESADQESLDLQTELEQTLRAYQSQTPAPALHVGSSNGLRVRGESERLRSALGHLLQNAIDAARSAESPKRAARVDVCLERHGPWAEIAIEDSGNGMDPEFVDKVLFQPFTSTKGVGGMGVGAYQARSYVRALGGDVSVTSHPGRGSRFTVRLPLQTDHD